MVHDSADNSEGWGDTQEIMDAPLLETMDPEAAERLKVLARLDPHCTAGAKNQYHGRGMLTLRTARLHTEEVEESETARDCQPPGGSAAGSCSNSI